MTQSDINTLTVTHNHWRIPSRQRAFSGWLEGAPTDAERQRILRETDAARASWKPNSEAMALVKELDSFVGYNVRVQMWCADMWFDERDGPYPFDANCIGVEVLQVGEFLQAFLRLTAVTEVPNDYGFSPTSYFQTVDDQTFRVSLADLYEISKVEVGGISE